MIQIETTLFNNIKARNETGKTVKNYKTFGLNLFEIIVQEKDIIENQRE